VQEFCDRAGVPYLYFTAIKGASPVESVASFVSDLSESVLPADRELIPSDGAANWLDALRVLAAVLPDAPSVVVIAGGQPGAWPAQPGRYRTRIGP